MTILHDGASQKDAEGDGPARVKRQEDEMRTRFGDQADQAGNGKDQPLAASN